MLEFGFLEGEDFTSVNKSTVVNNGVSSNVSTLIIPSILIK
ncbi:MAG: hypothetical protein WCR79_01700 [Fusobacterium sp.]